MVTLYEIPLSPYAQKVKLALLEKGIAFSAKLPDLVALDSEFAALSPRLEVPVFVDDEVRLFDSSVILEYLEDRWPEPALLPRGAAERARVRTLEEICDTLYDAVNWGVSEIVVFKRAEGDAAARMLARAKQQVDGLNARLERELANRAWFNGESIGYGDVAVYPFVNGAAALGNKPLAGGRLEAWLKTMRSRPSAQRVKQDVIDTLPQFTSRPKDIAEGRHRREYRDHRLDWMLRSGGLQIVLAGIQADNIRFSHELE
ncbi:MAG TPA: glutathione S-transferase family protein [Polyangiales bacterium]|nr:glutathione S-transferase family protein [Polyangiales bacterium]